MRIISGIAKGRHLTAFKGSLLRPTSDRIREAIFDILAAFAGCSPESFPFQDVLDIFAGTGAMGLEALSRGALRGIFVENNVDALKVLRRNIKVCDLLSRAEIIPLEASKALPLLRRKKKVFSLVFLDPPYGRSLVENTLNVLLDNRLLTLDAVVVAEHSLKEIPSEKVGGLRLEDRRRYGTTMVSFYTMDRGDKV